MSRQEHLLGSPKNIIGTSKADLILETLGKVYIKSGKSTKTLNEIIKNMMKSSSTNNIIVKDSIEDMEYPGDGWFVFEGSTKSLYFTYEDEFCSIIEGVSDEYVKKTGDTMTGALTINTSDAPLKITSQDLIKNLNAEYLNGVKGEKFIQRDEDEDISGSWEFSNYIKFWNGVLFGKDTYYDGSLISYKGFSSGYGGYGWMLDSETNTLTIDNLVVRKVLSVYELVVNKISATNGSLWISDASKITEAIDLTEFVYNTQTITPSVTFTYCGTQTYTDSFTTYTKYGESNLYSDDFIYNDLIIIGVRPETGLTLDNINTFVSEESEWLYWNYFTGKFFKVFLDQESSFYPPFKPNDILRCQKYEKGSIKYYDAIVTNTSTDFIIIRLGGSIFDKYTTVSVDDAGNVTKTENNNKWSDPNRNQSGEVGEEQILAKPQEGDSLIRIGNTNANSDRQGSIYITSSDDQSPYISIMDGVNRPDFSVLQRELIHIDKCGPNNESITKVKTRRPEKVRLGKLDGVFDPRFGIDQPKGYGLYGENVYLSGRIVALNTDDSEGELVGEYKGIWYQYHLFNATINELSNLDNYCRAGVIDGKSIESNYYYYANEITYNGSLWRCIKGHNTYITIGNQRTIYLPDVYLVIADITQTCVPVTYTYDNNNLSPWIEKVQKGESGSGYILDLTNQYAVFGGDEVDLDLTTIVETTEAHFFYDADELDCTWKVEPLDTTINWVTQMNWIIYRWYNNQWINWVDSTNWTTRKFDINGNVSTDPSAKFYYEIILNGGIRIEIRGFTQGKNKVDIKITSTYIDPDTSNEIYRSKNFNITRIAGKPAYDFNFVPQNLVYYSDGNWSDDDIEFKVIKNYNATYTELPHIGNGVWEDSTENRKFKIRWKNWSKSAQTLNWSFLTSNKLQNSTPPTQSPYKDIDSSTTKPKYTSIYFQLYNGNQVDPTGAYTESAVEDLPIRFAHDAATLISAYYAWDNEGDNYMYGSTPFTGNFDTMSQTEQENKLSEIWNHIKNVTSRTTLKNDYGWSINPPAKPSNGAILQTHAYSYDLNAVLKLIDDSPNNCYWSKPINLSGNKGISGLDSDREVKIYKLTENGSDGKPIPPSWSPCATEGTYNYPNGDTTLIDSNFTPPTGWTTNYIQEQEGYTVWWSSAIITSVGTGIPHFLIREAEDCDYIWSPPYQVSGKGEPGKDGIDGPSISFQGEWQANGKYYFNVDHRIVVFVVSGSNRVYYELKLLSEIQEYFDPDCTIDLSVPTCCILQSASEWINCDQHGHYTTLNPTTTNGDKVWKQMNLEFFNNVATQLLITDDIVTHTISTSATIYIGWETDGWALYGTGFKSKSYIPNEPVTLKDGKYVDLHGVEYALSEQLSLDGYFKYYDVSSATQTQVWDWITAKAVNTTTNNWKFRPYALNYANGYYGAPEIGFNPAEPFAARGIKLNFNPDENYYGPEIGKLPIANWKIIDSPAFVLTPTNAYFKGTLWSNGIEVTTQDVIEGLGIFKIHTEPGSADYWKSDTALNKIYNTIPTMSKNSIAYPLTVISDITATKWIIPEYYTESGNYYTKPWNIDNSTVANIPVKIKIHPTQHCLFVTSNNFTQNPYNPPTFNYSDIVTEIFQTNWSTYGITILPTINSGIFGDYNSESNRKYWSVENGILAWRTVSTGSGVEASIEAASSSCNCGTSCSHLFKITIGSTTKDCVVTKAYIDGLHHIVGVANTIDSITYQIKNIKVVSSESSITDNPDTLFLVLDISS